MPSLSIIIPVYNVKNYVAAAIRSATEQTFRDLEIILVDDGSADGSGDVCDAYRAQDSRIRVIHKQNGGLSSARNVGIAAATGEYVLLLDGDDRLHRGAAERLLRVAEEYSPDFVQFRYVEVSGDGCPDAQPETSAVTLAETPRELFEKLYLLGGVGASGCTKLFRRELLLRIPFESIRHEDEMWCTRAFQTPLKAAYIEDVLYDYVMREESIIHSRFSAVKLELFAVIRERLAALKALDFPDLLGKEYGKLFSSVVSLYCEARMAKDTEAVRKIRLEFAEQKEAIGKFAVLSAKYKLLFAAMRRCFGTIRLYYIYHRLRHAR